MVSGPVGYCAAMQRDPSGSRWRRPQVSSFAPLREAARSFCPPYESVDESASRLRIKLRDPSGTRPDISLRHRHVRRLFFRANYTRISCDVPGDGPPTDGELTFRFLGWFSRQRGSVAWKKEPLGGEEWLRLHRARLLEDIRSVEAVQSARILWSAERHVWRIELETLSGSMMSGITAFLPIAVPFDRTEAEGIIAMIDGLMTRGS
jgi:hypothetical protein